MNIVSHEVIHSYSHEAGFVGVTKVSLDVLLFLIGTNCEKLSVYVRGGDCLQGDVILF